MNIVDAHHHFWNPIANYHPWLVDEPMIPFRYGDYSSIRNPFLKSHYENVSKNWNIVANVTMEGEWNSQDPVGEALWMQEYALKEGKPAAHAARIWLDRSDLESNLEILRELPLVRSVRHKPRSNNGPNGPDGEMLEAAFCAGFSKLRDYNLMFELQTQWWHLQEAIFMAGRVPEVPIILNHTGLPSDRNQDCIDGWKKAMCDLAKLPQVYVKISGLGLPNHPWRLEDNREIILTTIDLFGPERCMFASNFPVDGLCGSFDLIYSGFDAATCELNGSEREALFSGTAAALYGIEIEPTSKI